MKYYLGIDNGGTTTKASVYNSLGEELYTASTETEMITPRPGVTERDMNEMWEANCRVIKKAVKGAKIDAADIAAVACCGHGKGLYLWGKDGRPAGNGIISTDRRAQEYVDAWRADGTEDKAFEISCQHIMACQPVALLRWLADNEPERVANVRWIFSCKDYIRFCLTGEAYAERTDFSGANLLNLRTGEYDSRLLALFGIEQFADALPPLKNAEDECGRISREAAELTGLMEGTIVAGGMFDIDACALAVNVTDEKNLCIIAGTWSINEYISSSPVVDGSILMNSLFCIPDQFLVEESSPTSAGNNTWFLKTMFPELEELAADEGESIYDLANQMVENVPTEELCPIFLPFLMGSNVNPNAMGAFVGMSNYHTREHMIRSVYEGIAFCHRYHLEKLMAARKVPFESIHLAGGAARSAVWTQMFADVMGMPIRTTSVNETGTLGCAIAASVACGEHRNLASAANKMTSLSEPVYPIEENIGLYDRKYALYLETIKALDSAWSAFAAAREN